MKDNSDLVNDRYRWMVKFCPSKTVRNYRREFMGMLFDSGPWDLAITALEFSRTIWGKAQWQANKSLWNYLNGTHLTSVLWLRWEVEGLEYLEPIYCNTVTLPPTHQPYLPSPCSGPFLSSKSQPRQAHGDNSNKGPTYSQHPRNSAEV